MNLKPRTIVTILYIFALAGCGQTGPLYLPAPSNSDDATVKDQVRPNQNQTSKKNNDN
jgi:predicted small lipoprotein YifL